MYHGERFNAWTHLVGAVLSALGALWLLLLASHTGDIWKIVSAAIYGVTLVLLYSASTIYHSVKGPAKRVLRKLDHLSIYLLIAGSYTPFTLVTLNGAWDKIRTDPITRMFVMSLAFYGMSTFEGPMLSIKAVNSL